MTRGKRELWGDYAKAIAIWVVVFSHCNLPEGLLSVFINYYHVPLFLFIAGYFCNFKEKNFKVIILQNLKQLIIPYFLFSFLYLSVGWISPFKHPELYYAPQSILEIIKCNFLGIFRADPYPLSWSYMPNPTLWFLICLFSIRILFAFSLKIHQYGYLFLVILSVFLYPYLTEINWFCADSTALSIPLFCTGYSVKILIKDYNFVEKLKKYGLMGGIALFCLAGICIILNQKVSLFNADYGENLGLFYVGCISLSMGSSIICHVIPKGLRFIEWIGQHTLSIYLIHYFFIIGFKAILAFNHVNLLQLPILISLCMSFLVLISCCICIRIYEKNIQSKG